MKLQVLVKKKIVEQSLATQKDVFSVRLSVRPSFRLTDGPSVHIHHSACPKVRPPIIPSVS